ncbi:MAG: translation initiation factor IF-3 [Oscillospiraceae bacterium]|nr:translation initiation factor IF-3 [Oscillospiraceae bacterium]
MPSFLYKNLWRCLNINKDFLVNEEIREKEVRLIDSDGTMIGIYSGRDAYNRAMTKELDLVMISPNATPPVCKIMDYNKFYYEQSKKDKEAKKKQKIINVKEIRLSLTIEEHDIDIKAGSAKKFLKDGDKVKVSIRFRGREMEHSDIGENICKLFLSKMEDLCVVEKNIKFEGKSMTMFLAPKKEK